MAPSRVPLCQIGAADKKIEKVKHAISVRIAFILVDCCKRIYFEQYKETGFSCPRKSPKGVHFLFKGVQLIKTSKKGGGIQPKL
jgi:hypothetical protein